MMKKLFFLALFAFPFLSTAQEQGKVENSTSGIQIGTLGAWYHKEIKLTDVVALRTEVGLDAGLWGSGLYPNTNFVITPVITLEPRWYYDLTKRKAKSKNIEGNSGNFLTLQLNYHPNWFLFSNVDNLTTSNQLSIIPSWGLKRNLGDHFTYEAGLGLGYRYIFPNSVNSTNEAGVIDYNLHLRIGYRF